MVNLTKKYTINNIAEWLLIDNASKLYCIDGKEGDADILQLDFYQDFRLLVYEVFKRVYKSPLNREFIKIQSESREIYILLHGQLSGIGIENEEHSKTEGLEVCDIKDLEMQLEELKSFEKNGCKFMTREEIVSEIIEIENALMKLYKKNPKAYKVRIAKVRDDYNEYKRKYFEEIHHLGKQNGLFIDYLKRSLWEEENVFPYDLDPNESDLFDRCLRKYKKRNIELIADIIEETKKEIKQEQNQMDVNL